MRSIKPNGAYSKRLRRPVLYEVQFISARAGNFGRLWTCVGPLQATAPLNSTLKIGPKLDLELARGEPRRWPVAWAGAVGGKRTASVPESADQRAGRLGRSPVRRLAAEREPRLRA